MSTATFTVSTGGGGGGGGGGGAGPMGFSGAMIEAATAAGFRGSEAISRSSSS